MNTNAIDNAVKQTMKTSNKKVNKTMTTYSAATKELADLANRASRSTVAVIDAMASRGAYKGEELAAIGQLREQSAQMIRLAETVMNEIAASNDGSPSSQN